MIAAVDPGEAKIRANRERRGKTRRANRERRDKTRRVNRERRDKKRRGNRERKGKTRKTVAEIARRNAPFRSTKRSKRPNRRNRCA